MKMIKTIVAMLAIGNGAQQEILNQIKLVGVNNIVIKPIIEQKDEKINEKVGKKEKKNYFLMLHYQLIVSCINVINYTNLKV